LRTDKAAEKKDSVGKSIIFTYFFSVLSAITGFTIVVVFSWLLSPEEWGVFTVAKRTGTLAATIAVLGIPIAISRYIPMERARKSSTALHYGTNAVYIVLISTSIAVVGWLIVLSVIPQNVLGEGTLVLPLFAATLFFVSLIWQLFTTSFLRAEGYIRHYNVMIFAGQVFQLIFGCAAILVIGAMASYTIVGSSVGIFGVVLISIVLLKHLRIVFFRREYLDSRIQKELLTFGLPRMGMGIFDILLLSFSMLLLGFTGKTIEAGLFAIALQFVAILQLIFQPIAIVMLPEFSKLHGLQDSENIKNKIQILTQGWIYIIVFILIMVLTYIEPVFTFIFKADYADAITIIKILMIGVIPFSFYLTIYSYINAILKRPVILYVLIIGLFVNMGMFFLLVPLMGAIGAAIATAGGMITVGILMVALLLKFQPRAFAAVSLPDFILCQVPLAGIIVSGLVIGNIFILLFLTAGLLGVYIYLLKNRNIAWFTIIEKSYLKR